MATPQKSCDLVMKGGITSGVVYPMAVVELAREYRFDNIGGTSAGAIAAVITAAAEYGREEGGFDKVAKLPDDLSKNLLEKFQPTPKLKPLFDLLIASMEGGKTGLPLALLGGYRGDALFGAAPGAAIFLLALFGGSAGFAVLGLLVLLLGAFFMAGRAALRQVTEDVPTHDYGMCTGLTQPGAKGPALTDWMCQTIDDAAGLKPGEGPLTVRHLHDRGIKARTVTTDITTHRPFALPMGNNYHAFSEKEFRRLFPAYVVDHMIANSAPVPDHWGPDAADLHFFRSDALPVVVLARMSLSFPGLISAVPLHRIDYTLVHPDAKPCRRRCLFSDGGISSNFPVHFFDEFLPQTPTFGIALAELDPMRVRPGSGSDGRVRLPSRAGSGLLLPTRPFKGLGGFVMALFDSAKDWQDSLQSILPGYRERIVTVNLSPEEGGMNLNMPRATITELSRLGARAGGEIVESFDLNEHRWRRYLVELRGVDEMLRQFARSWYRTEVQPGAHPYPDLASDYAPKSFKGLSRAQRELLKSKAERIAELGRELEADAPISENGLPRSRSRLRNIAEMDDWDGIPATDEEVDPSS